ncbi:hypothetical protein RhiirA1_453908 [Rhizophagus irregularis]|uniref:Uncharacterized protein n=2 Tax=Rhizophagus irregularis TaxID=588596 RepID=A0A2I1E9J0_9GLOM|nr:hypothetical protein RhiirA1_453908 [Rhizophagus irregularis]PKY18763.1 hypothetical protein RhiirB3_431641 [Rhizophagus irregularis]GET57325.1 hypothetical protein RIR_e62959_A0A2I1E9J0_9GLOM [Rhizophagus irregularis DAOM 181602=DAOM 197198]
MKLDPFDPTPKLRFSPVPISFVSFNDMFNNNRAEILMEWIPYSGIAKGGFGIIYQSDLV